LSKNGFIAEKEIQSDCVRSVETLSWFIADIFQQFSFLFIFNFFFAFYESIKLERAAFKSSATNKITNGRINI
jgi:uncharacterized membrane protein YeiB